MDSDYWICSLIVFFLIVVFTMILHGFDAAISGLTEIELQVRAENDDAKARKLLALLQKEEYYKVMDDLLTPILGIVSGVLVVPSVSDKILEQSFCGQEWYWSIGVYAGVILIMILILVFFGITLPRQVSLNAPEKWALRYSGVERAVEFFAEPFMRVINALTAGVIKLFGHTYHAEEEAVTEDEIISMVNEGHEQGVLEQTEAEMIHNIFEFNDKCAEDIMTRRTEINALSADITLDEAVLSILEQTNSRYPVYREQIDELVGVMHLKDAMKAYQKQENHNRKISEIPGLLRDVRYVPRTRNVADLFQKMQQENVYMVIVVDEYGQTDGLITMEDILEEIVGNIFDEYDEEENDIIRLEQDTYRMEGLAPLKDVEEQLGIRFHDDDHDTLSGYMTAQIGRIPVSGSEEDFAVEVEGFAFRAERIENRVISLVRVEKINKSEEKEK